MKSGTSEEGLGMLNVQCVIVGIGLDLMISEHSPFKIQHSTDQQIPELLHGQEQWIGEGTGEFGYR